MRPFHFEDVILASTDIKPEPFHEKKVLKYCAERVEALVRLSQEEHTGHRYGQRMHRGTCECLSICRYLMRGAASDNVFHLSKYWNRQCYEILDLN